MADAGEFRYASDLVAFIRAETGDWFHIDVAGYPEYHPQARNPHEDLDNFERKVARGADSAITQYFFNRDAYGTSSMPAPRAGSTIPIVPGIMPIASSTRLARFSDACGAEIPRWIRRKLESYGDDTASVRAFGLDVVTELCAGLLDGGAPGLHFYTLNTAASRRRSGKGSACRRSLASAMSNSREFIAYVLEMMEPREVPRTRHVRRHGVYLDGLIVGIVDDDVLYLKTDAQTRRSSSPAISSRSAMRPRAARSTRPAITGRPTRHWRVPRRCAIGCASR
jgi:hypothetical protein